MIAVRWRCIAPTRLHRPATTQDGMRRMDVTEEEMIANGKALFTKCYGDVVPMPA